MVNAENCLIIDGKLDPYLGGKNGESILISANAETAMFGMEGDLCY